MSAFGNVELACLYIRGHRASPSSMSFPKAILICPFPDVGDNSDLLLSVKNIKLVSNNSWDGQGHELLSVVGGLHPLLYSRLSDTAYDLRQHFPYAR